MSSCMTRAAGALNKSSLSAIHSFNEGSIHRRQMRAPGISEGVQQKLAGVVCTVMLVHLAISPMAL